MSIIVRNGGAYTGQVIVEDIYPESISGVLCFARSGGCMPTASASGGKITWHIFGMKPGEIRELIYTSLPIQVLRNQEARKRPSDHDFALLACMCDRTPSLVLEDAVTDPITNVPPPEEEKPFPEGPAKTMAEPTKTVDHRPNEANHSIGRVLAIGAGKGGTGKTIISINFSIARLMEALFKS